MIVGLVLIGTMLGTVATVGALIFGASIWTALLVYTAVSTASVVGLALAVALLPYIKVTTEQAALTKG